MDTRRWAGVPFYLRTGKRLGRRVTEIAVVFKRAPHLPFDATSTEELGQNAIVFRVQPDEGVTMRFGSKVPGSTMEVRDVNMDFSYGHSFTESSPEAYERLILDMLLGEPSLFPKNDEVELSWQILDPILKAWHDEREAGAVPGRHLGSGLGGPDAFPHRPALEAPMIIDLPATTTSQVNSKLVHLREQGGANTIGRVLTLVIVTDDNEKTEDVIDAANHASREHPCRVIVVARGAKKAAPRLDAQIRVGGDAGASEVIVLRLYGPLANEGASCVVPLLLPDAPIVAWWPFESPASPAKDPIGRLATRRITDAAAERNPTKALEARAKSYADGDTDLAWTRLTLWRALLAAALDLPPYEKVTAATVSGESDSPSADLLAAWLAGAAAAAGEADEGQVRPGHRVGGAGTPVRQHRDPPPGRRGRHAGPAGPAGPAGRAAAARGPGLHRRGAAAARPGRDLRARAEVAEQGRPRPGHAVGPQAGQKARSRPCKARPGRDQYCRPRRRRTELASATADRLAAALASAQAARGTASVVLTGGRTGDAVLAALRVAPRSTGRRVDIYWGDERFLPAGDPERNETQAREALLDHVPVSPDRVHPMAPSDGEFGDDPDAAAEAYAVLLQRRGRVRRVPARGRRGGPHGVALPALPRRPETARAVVAVRDCPKPPPTRVSLTLPTIRRADRGLADDDGRGEGGGGRCGAWRAPPRPTCPRRVPRAARDALASRPAAAAGSPDTSTSVN